MNVELILGGVGTLLGIANFVYWSWWTKRDIVKIINSRVYAEFLPKGTHENTNLGSITLACAVIMINASCELVLKSGNDEIEVRNVEISLNKKVCQNLDEYFDASRRRTFDLYEVDYYGNILSTQHTSLIPKKVVYFQSRMPIDCIDEYENKLKHKQWNSCPDFIQPQLDKLETKYEICWTRYDGKRSCWKFPDRWWKNLGKKLWG